MNEKLKNAILESIRIFGVDYKSYGDPKSGFRMVHSFKINNSNYLLKINCRETAGDQGFEYSIEYNNEPVINKTFVPHGIMPVRSALAVDLVEIWNAAQKKYHAQQRAELMSPAQTNAAFFLTAHLHKQHTK